MLLDMLVVHSFFFFFSFPLSTIPFLEISQYIHSLDEGHLGCFHFLALMKRPYKHSCVSHCVGHIFSFL